MASRETADVLESVLSKVRARNEREYGQFKRLFEDYANLAKRDRIYRSQISTLRAKLVLMKERTAHATSSPQERENTATLKETLRQIRESMSKVKQRLAEKTQENDVLKQELEKRTEILEKSEANVRELTLTNEHLVEQMIESKSALGIEMNKMTNIVDQKIRHIALLEKEVRELKARGNDRGEDKRRSSSGGFWSAFTKSGSEKETNSTRLAEEMVGRTSGWRRAAAVSCPSSSVQFFQAHKSEINDLAFCMSEGRELCVSASSDSTVKMWDSRSGQSVGTLRSDSPVMSVAARNGVVVGGTTDSKAIVWVAKTQRTRYKMTGHRGKIMSVEFSSNAKQVVTAATDRTVKVWDVSRNKCEGTLHCPSECTSATFTLDGSTVITSHKDSGLRFWDLRSKAMQQEIKNIHRAVITCVKIAPSGSGTPRILSASRDNSLAISDGRTFMEIARFRDIKFRIGTVFSKVCFSPRAGYVAAGGGTGSIFVWDTTEPSRAPQLLDGHSSCVTACSWGRRVLGTGDRSGYLALWI